MSAISINGRVFELNGTRWSPKGLCYQPTNDVDPISDNNLSTIQALLAPDGNWTKLGINALRVYQVEPNLGHDKVMQLLSDNGIYVMVGCVNTHVALPRDGSYPCTVLDRVKSVVDTFQKYDNVLSFSVSNELLYQYNQPNVAAVAKALVRDTKAYIVQKGYRSIPVGLVLRDDPNGANTLNAAHFYACGSAAERADYVGYNQYRWCDYSSPVPQGSINAWYELYDSFKDFPVPVYFSEYGCNAANNRTWTQVPYLFGIKPLTPTLPGSSQVNMSDVVSGGFAFRYIQHSENFGLVDNSGNPIAGHGFADLGTQYDAVKSFSASTVNGTNPLPCDSSYNPPLPASCGGSAPVGPTIAIQVTNEITPATTISWSYTTDSDPNSANWTTLQRMAAGAPPTSIQFPTNATWLSLAYQSTQDQQWYGGCRIAASSISAGDTVHGAWVAPNGTGTCPIN